MATIIKHGRAAFAFREESGERYREASKAPSVILPGMPARVRQKPRVAIVGAGNLASALAVSLRAAGYRIELIVSRKPATSLRRARPLSGERGVSRAPGGAFQRPAEEF